MEIVADITKEDVVAYNLYHAAHSPAIRRLQSRAVSLIFVVWALLLAALVLCSDEPLDTAKAIWPLLLGPLLFLLLMKFWAPRHTKNAVRGMLDEGENKGIYGEHKIVLSPEGISESNTVQHTATSWNAVERVVVTDQHVFVYISAVSAVIAPRRAFVDTAHFMKFAETATQFHSLASKDSTREIDDTVAPRH